jgi:hypothetical protein
MGKFDGTCMGSGENEGRPTRKLAWIRAMVAVRLKEEDSTVKVDTRDIVRSSN